MRDELAEGQILAGKYRVDRMLARGGMGLVFEAHHVTLRERVAIKVLDTALVRSPEARVRFEREARFAVKIRSEHVAQILDVGHLESGAPYIVMEFLEGEDLARRLAERGPLSVAEAVDFVLQAGVAVADAHAAGIVHRDLKPGNLVCVRRSDGRALIKVLDFGISKWAGDAEESGGVSVTRTEQVLGSPLYMSPEQVQSARDVDLRTDLWSLGAVLFELLTGKPPFSGDTFGEVAVRISTQPPPPLPSLRPDLPRALDAVVSRCLTRERRQRYASMAELAQALLPFAADESRALVTRIQRIPRASGAAAPVDAPHGSTQPSHAPVETTVGVAEQPAPPAARAPNASHVKRALFGGALVALVALAALAAAALRDDAPVEARAATEPIPTAEPAPRPTSAAPPNNSTAAEPVAEPLQPADPAASASAAPAQASSASPAKPRPTPTAVRPSPAAASSAPVAKPPAKPKPDCNPRYYIDERGRRRFKPECYLEQP